MVDAIHKKVCFIVPFYGRWPRYWNLWAKSVSWNPEFHFHVFTDLEKPDYCPTNITIHSVRCSDFVGKIAKAINRNIGKTGYHKLCDFRPFYGMAFGDSIAEYDYWGYCDVDIIIGDLKPLTQLTEQDFDVISPWCTTAGHCTLVKNSNAANTMALSTPDLQARLCEPQSTFMDEGNVHEMAVKHGLKVWVVDSIAEEFRKPRCLLGATIEPGGRIAGLDGVFLATCSNGKTLLYDRHGAPHEVLYLHFMGMKQPRYWKAYAGDVIDTFSVTPYGFVSELLSPDNVTSVTYAVKSVAANIRANVYKSVRGVVPQSLVNYVKSLR